VGGDLFDFFFVDEDHLCFLIGDVSDKGVPAALFMARTKTLIKSLAAGRGRPSEILKAANRELSVNNDSMMFVTAVCGSLQVSTGKVCYTNAGHNPPLVIGHDREVRFLEGTGDTALGIDEDLEFHEAELVLAPGDTVLLYTDGVTEAFDDRDEAFSEERLQREAAAGSGRTAQEIADAVSERVKTFTGAVPQSDDIAILVLQYLQGTACKQR
jgi:sigma-B regulation protein RsbU (phosphoserine phosphatase)